VIETRAEMAEIRSALAAEFRTAIDDACARIGAVLDPASPTTDFLVALAAEVRTAETAPASVPYPELADPDRYWAASVLPQIRALRDQVGTIIEWLESRVITTMEVAERELKLMVDEAMRGGGVNPLADRRDLEAALHERCNELHDQMAALLTVMPDPGPVVSARQWLSDAMQAQASADVDSLKTRYLAEAGGDDAHQQFAEQQWTETYLDRVAHRLALLAGAPPWRHQELALIGYERTVTACGEALQSAVGRLQAPLAGIPDILLERFDQGLGD